MISVFTGENINKAPIFALIVSIVLTAGFPLSAQALDSKVHPFLDIKMTAKDAPSAAPGDLSANAQELADLLNIRPLVVALWQAKQLNSDSTKLPKSLQYARLLCLWKIFTISEEERKAVGRLNHDLASSYVILDSLVAKRNMTINMLNTANFMQAGILGTVKESLGLTPGTNIPRQDLIMVSGGIGVILPTIELFMPYVWSHQIDSPPNILARIFNKEYAEASTKDSSYLWRYFNSPVPGSSISLTRREMLIKHWEAFAHINAQDQQNICKLAALPYLSRNMHESIFYINRRITLMHDLNTHIEEFNLALCELQRAISFD